MILEQGLALDELVRMKTRKGQGESGGKRPQPPVGAAGRDDVPPSSEFSDGDGREQGGGTCSRGSLNVQQQLKSYGGTMEV